MTDVTQENIFTPHEVARQLNISESTLRKYSLLLEDTGYTFDKNSRGQRAYYDSDIIAIRRMMDLKNGGMTLERASQVVYESWAKDNKAVSVIENERYNDQYEELKKMIQQQNELIQQLTVKLDEQEQRINERDRQLMNVMNDMLEVRKQLEAPKKKGFFSRLFNR